LARFVPTAGCILAWAVMICRYEVNMQQRKIGQRMVSEIGLGCWQLGAADWGDIDDAAAERILSEAFQQGVTFWDTADVYGSGLSETRIGRFLSSIPDAERPFLATKLGRFSEPGWPANFTYDAMRRHTEASLQRLQVSRVDLTQLHCIPAEVMQRGEVFDHLRRFQEEGLIGAFGASVETVDEALQCLQVPGLASLQIIFNVFRQKPIDELFGRARERGVALIVRLPLASGLLSGKMTRATTFAANDHRSYNRDGQAFNVGETFAGLPFEKGVELVGELMALLDGQGLRQVPLPQLALRYCLDFDAVTTVIPGASSVAQVRSNVQAAGLSPLGESAHAALRAFYESKVHPLIRGRY
jgi:aryl-alcohol dehydrogenase-like predicted oxidoreductase